jgi:sigma-B regulation protein RsbU (phosphoserine phosphatase)
VTTISEAPARPRLQPVPSVSMRPGDAPIRREPRLPRTLRQLLEKPTPLLKQAPFTLLVTIGLALTQWTDFAVDPKGLPLLATAAIVAATTLVAALATLFPRLAPVITLVVLSDFVAILTLRHATGDAKSIFGILVVIPLLWMSSNLGRRYIAYASGGVVLVFVPPLLTPGAVAVDPTAAIRVAFVVVTFTIAAFVVNELALQASRRIDTSRAYSRVLAKEIEQGALVQQALLPKAGPVRQGYDVAGACIPATLVGGDFYDWYDTADGLGFTIGDVMGKGVGAGIIAATARAVIRSARGDGDPTVALRLADSSLSDELGDFGSFATIFHARLHPETGRVRYADAGHGLTIHVRADGAWTRLPSSGLPLGLGLQPGWDAAEVTLDEGDLLVSFSDGVLDFYDGSLTALDHLARLARDAASADDLVAAVRRLAHSVDHDDDVTVLVVRRTGTPA